MAIDTIGTNAITNDAVTSAKIPAGAVVASDVADGSVTTAKLADNAVTSAKALNLGRRNLIINGSMTNWQRGTSFSSNVYGCDRWKFYAPGSHANTRSTDTPDSPNNFKYSNSCGGSGDATGITQFIESGNCVHVPTSGSTKVILSFYLKHTTNSGTAKITSVVGTMDVADTSGATTNRSTQNHNTTTSWARYTHEMTGADLTAAATNGLQVTIKHNGSGATLFLVTAVQLEIAEAATDYERQFAKDELEDCQRYFIKSGDLGTADEWYPGVATYSGAGRITAQCLNDNEDRAPVHVKFPSYMRGAPTIVYYPGRAALTQTAGSIAVYNGNTAVTTSGKPLGRANGLQGYFQGTSTDSAAYVFQFTADAEL